MINLTFLMYLSTNVDIDKGTLTVLSPQPKPLPKTILLASDVQFVDLK